MTTPTSQERRQLAVGSLLTILTSVLILLPSPATAGNMKSMLLIGEAATLVEAGGKTLAAGACAATGNTDAAKRLISSAGQTFIDYGESNCITGNLVLLTAHCKGEEERVKYLCKRQGDAWTGLAENTPVVGHAIGIGRYAAGDRAGGDRCMLGATRSAVVGAVTLATAGAGALVCGAATVAGGAVFDGVATGCNSAAKGAWAPTGHWAVVAKAADTGDAVDIFNACASYGVEFGGAALTGALRAHRLKLKAERSTPAAELAAGGRGRRPSMPEQYHGRSEVPGASPQLSPEVIAANPETAALVRTHASAADAMRSLRANAQYDFVRLRDGRYVTVSHADAARISSVVGADLPVGHTSLVPAGAEVVAAGEIHVNGAGVITNVNCQSGHFRFPLSELRAQIGSPFPRSVITFESPTFTSLFQAMSASGASSASPGFLGLLEGVTIIGRQVMTIGLDSVSDWAKAGYVLAWWQGGHVEMLICADQKVADYAFDAIPDLDRILWRRGPNAAVMRRWGAPDRVQECVHQAERLNVAS